MRFWKPRAKRLAALVCALAMTASLLPTAVFADTGETVSVASSSVTEEEKTEEGQNTPSVPDEQPKEQPSPEPSESPVPSAEPTPSASPEGSPEPSESPEPAGTPTPTPSASPEVTAEPSESPTPSEEPTEEPTEETTDEAVKAPQMAPSEVTADNGIELMSMNEKSVYTNEENGINIYVDSNSATNYYPKTINFTVIVNGEEVASDVKIEGIPRALSYLHIEAEDYTATTECSSGLSIRNDTGSLLMTFGIGNTFDCTINLASEATQGSYEIVDKDNDKTYGVFGWAKSLAGSSAYAHDLEVYVNGAETPEYITKVNTPRSLSNANNNPEFWFQPNTDSYMASYEIDPSSIITEGSTIKVYLKTKCACGLPTCVCEGGCDCVEACSCDKCEGDVEDNIIPVVKDGERYGTIEYNGPYTDLTPKAEKVKVEVYVDHEYAFSKEIENVGNMRANALNLVPAEGYYFPAVNAYDIDNVDDSYSPSWDKNTGYLNLGPNPNKDGKIPVLRLYLYSFPGAVLLDVTRAPSVVNDITAYTVEFTYEGKTYKREVDNFDTVQSICIPQAVDVKLTAVCKDGKVVKQWACHNAWDAKGVVISGTDDDDYPDAAAPYAFGEELTLRVIGSQYTIVTVFINEIGDPDTQPTIPTDIKAAVGPAVEVKCKSDSAHVMTAAQELIDGTYMTQVMAADTIEVTITDPTPYVQAFDHATRATHKLDPAEQGEKVITLKQNPDDGKWVVQDAPVTYMVTCATPEDKPSADDIWAALQNLKVTIDCVNDGHEDRTFTADDGIENGYTFTYTDLQPAKEDGAWTLTATVYSDPYIAAYDKEIGSKHALKDGEVNQQQVSVTVKRNAYDSWEGTLDPNPVTFNVYCIPDPTADEIRDLGKMVEIVCDVANSGHEGKTFNESLRGGEGTDFVIEHGPLSTEATVTILKTDAYVNVYNSHVAAGHAYQKQGSDLSFGLVYENGAWKLNENDTATVKVYCIPDPTADEIRDLGKMVEIVCDVANSGHEGKTFNESLRGGEGKDFVIEHEPLSDEAVVRITMTDLYVKAYNDHNTKTPHTYVEAGSDLSFRLRYVNGAWTLDESDPDATIRVTCALDVTVDTVALNVVRLLCDTNENHKGIQTALLADTFMVNATDKVNGTATVTLKDDAETMAQYAKVMDKRGGTHTYNTEAQNKLTLELVFDTETLQWTCADHTTKATLHFNCEIPAPEHVTQADLEALLDVAVNCGKDKGHGEGRYEVISGSWNDGGTQTDADGSSYIMVRVRPDRYVAEYNSDVSLTLGWPHTVVDAQKEGTLIRLNWNAIDGKWELADAANATVTFTVECDATYVGPKAPTDPELSEIVDVVLDCTSPLNHDAVSYDIISGSWNHGQMDKQDDGSYLTTVRIHSAKYVDEYNKNVAAKGLTHTAAQESGTVQLRWTVEDGWQAATDADKTLTFALDCKPADAPTDDGKTDSGSGSNGNSNNNSNNANSNANNNNQVTVNNNVSSNAAAAPAASTVIPQTSDDMPIGLLVGLAVVAAGGLAALLVLRKRRSDR